MRGQRPLAMAVGVALPLLSAILMATEGLRPLGIFAGWAMAIAIAIAIARALHVPRLEASAAVCCICMAWYASAGTRYAPFVSPVAIYAVLLWVFGRTLLPGRDPLVSAIARIVRGVLPPELMRYTRQVTWAWCGFFVAMAATSILLATLAPIAAWSLFVNILTFPLIALMFAGEYAYRRWRFPGYTHFTPMAVAKRVAEARDLGATVSK